MSKKIATRTVQWPLIAEFVFNYNDYAADSVSTVKKTFGSTTTLADPASLVTGLTGAVADTLVLDVIPMPIGAVITGGEIIVETAYAGCTAATLKLGVAGGDLDKLTGDSTVDLMTVGRTALTLTSPLLASSGANLRATIAYTVANATAGKARIRVMYTIDGKQSETVIV